MTSAHRRNNRDRRALVKAERDRIANLRKQIVLRWAIRSPGGAVRCGPSGRAKVMFASEDRARQCERQLAEQCHSLRQVPYECRTTPGHWHLTKWEWGTSL
jgi:hypothetical protein